MKKENLQKENLQKEILQKEEDFPYLEKLSQYLSEIKYGTITLVIQDGKVIQIERTEKVRL